MSATLIDQPLPSLPTPADDRPHLIARSVITLEDALLMGTIRNVQRAGFSGDTTPIDESRQRAWWLTNRHRVIAYLYRDQGGNTVGYGALRQGDDGRWWSTCATLPGHEGKGYGGTIVRHLVETIAVPEVWAKARKDNPAAQRLHNAAQWEIVGEDAETIHYRTKPRVRLEVAW